MLNLEKKSGQIMQHIAKIGALMLLLGAALAPVKMQAQNQMELDLFTTVDRLFDLEKGMTMETVIATLQCEPHAVIQHTEGGYLMLEWRYLHKDRWISAEQSKQDAFRVEGDAFWVEPSSVYLMFNNAHEFVNYVTQDGLSRMRDAYAWQATSQAVGLERTACKACEVTLPASFAPEQPEAEEEEPAARGLGGLLGGGGAGAAGSPTTVEETAPATGLGGLGNRLNGIGQSLRPSGN